MTAGPPIGEVCPFDQLEQRVTPGRWCALGIPVSFDAADPVRGSAGPAFVRKALPYLGTRAPRSLWDWNAGAGEGAAVDLTDSLPLDFGDVRYSRRADRAADVEARIAASVAAIRRHGGRPLVLGAEHWVTEPVLRGLLSAGTDDEVYVVHFDAHTDTDRGSFGGQKPPPLRNCNVMSFVEALDGVRTIVQLGVRELDVAPTPATASPFGKTRVVGSRRILAGAAPADLLADIPAGAKVYITVDTDVLDPVIAPEVGWPVPGGLSLERLLEILNHVRNHYNVVGMDVVEVFGGPDGQPNRAALAMARCILSVISSGAI